ncbi:MAG TPA: MBL fold metallo-hydrolase [Polyangiaceae bacterium]|jgi:glyoxylase-like metal-dependent hydrolase (beta-lactamase superfamily II)|nr:MBL fold metallo-hydrolase [Polyangiaceae bacterium]
MLRHTLAVGALGCNCSIVADEQSKVAIVIDPGGDFEKIRALLEQDGLQCVAIVHTHTHIDHVGATAPLQRHCNAGALIHEADRFLYQMLPVQAALLRVPPVEQCDVEGSLVDGKALSFGAFELGVIHTPGHTPGSVSFWLETEKEKLLFSGDTLFRRSIGRTDLWGGDHEQILSSLKQRVMTLPDSTVVVPGHGPNTTIAAERRTNPFLQ